MVSKRGAVVLGREEFYALVWSEPMVRLAQRFTVTDVALAKTCRRSTRPVNPTFPRDSGSRRMVAMSSITEVTNGDEDMDRVRAAGGAARVLASAD